MRIFSLLVALIIGPLAGLAHGQDSTWVTGVEGRASMETIGRADARAQAIRNAHAQAVMEAYGVQIMRGFFMQQSELVRDGRIEEANVGAIEVIMELAGARLARQIVVLDTIENVARPDVSPRPEFVVRIDALVVRENGPRDPGYVLTLNGLRETYRPGEAVTFDVEASRNGYLHVFSFGADGQVYHSFPNAFEPDDTLKAGVPRRLPGVATYDLTAVLPEGHTIVSETLLAIATRDDAPFLIGDRYRQDPDFAEVRRADMEQLIRWVLQIPSDRRVETTESYVIQK